MASPFFTIVSAEVPGWARGLEVGAVEGESGVGETSIEVAAGDVLIAAISADGPGAQIPYAGVEIQSPRGNERHSLTAENPLLIVDAPEPGAWKILIRSEGGATFTVNISAFAAKPKIGKIRRSSLKCKACKIIAKALAAAIVAAATLPNLPASLVAAVAKFLGILAVPAAAFIANVINDALDMITEALCRKITLCP